MTAAGPPPYTRGLCTRREHVVSNRIDPSTFEKPATIAEDDERRHSCDCRLVMIGNGHVEVRFGLLDHLFPQEDA